MGGEGNNNGKAKAGTEERRRNEKGGLSCSRNEGLWGCATRAGIEGKGKRTRTGTGGTATFAGGNGRGQTRFRGRGGVFAFFFSLLVVFLCDYNYIYTIYVFLFFLTEKKSNKLKEIKMF